MRHDMGTAGVGVGDRLGERGGEGAFTGAGVGRWVGAGVGAGEDREIGGGHGALLVAGEEGGEGRSVAGGGEEGGGGRSTSGSRRGDCCACESRRSFKEDKWAQEEAEKVHKRA